MKKKLCIILCFILVFCCPFALFGCGETNFSIEDIENLYYSVKNEASTKEFFNKDKINVVFDAQKVDISNNTNKNYIFPQVYDYYLKSSSRFFSLVVERTNQPSFVLKYFSQAQLNNIYNSLSNVKNKLNVFSTSKTIYEESLGEVYYKDFLLDYNNLISALLNFNDLYSSYYFETIGKVDYSDVSLSEGIVKDMLCLQLLRLSKISFNYELLTFKISNPMGEIIFWYNSTDILKDFITLAHKVILRLDSTRGILDGVDQEYVKTMFKTIQNETNKFLNEYDKFTVALSNFDIKAYQNSTNKSAYLEMCSAKERSNFNVMQNFLNGRYSALYNAVNSVTEKLKF